MEDLLSVRIKLEKTLNKLKPINNKLSGLLDEDLHVFTRIFDYVLEKNNSALLLIEQNFLFVIIVCETGYRCEQYDLNLI